MQHADKGTPQAKIDAFLTAETAANRAAPWNKLDKTTKLKILNAYTEQVLRDKHELTPTEVQELKDYFNSSLDRKKLQYVKDVTYDKTTGQLVLIPGLLFNASSRKFTIKYHERRPATAKSSAGRLTSLPEPTT